MSTQKPILPARTTPITPAPEAPKAPTPPAAPTSKTLPKEIGGPAGPEPTRHGDWHIKGRVSDF